MTGVERPPTRVGAGSRVTLHFSLCLEDGTEIDSTRRRRPATFVVGDGNLLPGFESLLFGMTSGEDRSFVVPPEQAFGMPNDDNVQRFARARFAESDTEPGTVVAFADAAGAEVCGVVCGVDGDDVVVDFNHPLAGKRVVFDVSVLRVEDYLVT